MTIYRRVAWGASGEPDGYPLTGPLGNVWVHHTVASTPTTVDEALAEVHRIWIEHTGKGWLDIGYSWLVDDLGNGYEGRGWLRTQAAQEGYNSKGHSICWMGNAMTRRPSNKALACIAQIIVDGIKAGAVTPAPAIGGHRDVNPTACPGDLLYSALDVVRAAVTDLPPATIDPPPEDDAMTEADRAWLQGQLNAVSGTVTTNAAYLGQWLQGLAGEHGQILARLDDIAKRLGALEAGEIPTPDEIVLAAAKRITEGAPK